ncbi:hypothetical protein ANCDUO_00424 [Ancylostoma duodenale]|uniref:C-type lectin domain-containing protein n=1 Tax=Ancylostoma duodenale TaxID=51022 RepID=A0A0C2HC56_9BILA|nr:hypothetical protein ANCDUO_00424 [Ancylostoma duodenale]
MEDTWMGLHMTVTNTSRTYKWEDGTRFDYKNFAPGEPNVTGNGEFCGQLNYKKEDKHFGTWKIAKCCDTLLAYTCKKPADGKTWGNLAPLAINNTDFPHKFKGNQYIVMDAAKKVNFTEARLQCQSMNADLASLHSREEIEFVKRGLSATKLPTIWAYCMHSPVEKRGLRKGHKE